MVLGIGIASFASWRRYEYDDVVYTVSQFDLTCEYTGTHSMLESHEQVDTSI